MRLSRDFMFGYAISFYSYEVIYLGKVKAVFGNSTSSTSL